MPRELFTMITRKNSVEITNRYVSFFGNEQNWKRLWIACVLNLYYIMAETECITVYVICIIVKGVYHDSNYTVNSAEHCFKITILYLSKINYFLLIWNVHASKNNCRTSWSGFIFSLIHCLTKSGHFSSWICKVARECSSCSVTSIRLQVDVFVRSQGVVTLANPDCCQVHCISGKVFISNMHVPNNGKRTSKPVHIIHIDPDTGAQLLSNGSDGKYTRWKRSGIGLVSVHLWIETFSHI